MMQSPPKFGKVAKKEKKLTAGSTTTKNTVIRPISDPPKKPMSGFFQFLQEHRSVLMNKNPDMAVKDVAKESGATWKAMTDAQRQKYQKLFDADKARYQKEQIEFDRVGYFTFLSGPNKGSKSSEFCMSLKNFPEGTVTPKTAMSASMCFMHSKKGQGLKLQEIHALWSKLNEKQK